MKITICYTTDILNEYSEILMRFYHQQFVSDIINELLLSANVVKANNYYKWNLITTDPDDNKFVDCALNVGADYIVTNDRHFNVLKFLDFPPIKVIDIENFKNILTL
jgi:putative PIN family toxin of toxin-antitoxin system